MNGLHAQSALEAAPNNQHSRSVHEGPKAEHKASVFTRRTSQVFGYAASQEIEGGPWFMERRRLANAVEQDFVRVGMVQGEFEIALDRLAESARVADSGVEFASGFQAEAEEDVVAIAVALIDRGRSRAGRLGDGTHSEGLFAAASPQARGALKDALLQIRIGLPWQRVLPAKSIY